MRDSRKCDRGDLQMKLQHLAALWSRWKWHLHLRCDKSRGGKCFTSGAAVIFVIRSLCLASSRKMVLTVVRHAAFLSHPDRTTFPLLTLPTSSVAKPKALTRCPSASASL